MDTKDEIKARLPIDQLVSQYAQLKKKGRSFVCLCPFHNDSHPSLLVSPDKGIAYCFACQSGGDIFSFYQKIESVDFPTAVRQLAEKVGVKISAPQLRVRGPSKDEKERLRECLEAAATFYQKKLFETPAALAYVRSRGVPDDLIRTFGIGFAPDSFSETYEVLLKGGFSKAEVIASGLAIQKDLAEGRIYDRFRNRILFPISDPQGGIVGFGGRALGDDDAKYINSPESVLYRKSSVLFGLRQARDAIRATHRIVLVEGYFDAVAAHKAFVPNVVAVSGTALTEEHVKLLKRYGDEVILCLDQDSAGELAASRAFGLLAALNLKILSITLPAKDPDELVQRDPLMLRHLVEKTAVPYIDAVIDRLEARPDLRDPSGKREIRETLFPLLGAIRSATDLRAYLEKAAKTFGVVATELLRDFREWKGASQEQPPQGKGKGSQETPFSRYELCLGIAFVYPPLRQFLSELIPGDNESLRDIHRVVRDSDASLGIREIASQANADGVLSERLGVLALYCEENFGQWSESLAAREFRKLIAAANKDQVTRKQMEIVRGLRDARNKGRVDEEAKLLTQYQQVLRLTKMAGESR